MAPRLADDPRAGRALELRLAGDTRGLAAHPRGGTSGVDGPGDRRARGRGLARVDAPELLEHRRRRGARGCAELRDAALRLRADGARPDRLGGRAAAPRPRVTVGGDHHVPAAHRHELHPVRQPPRLLARRRRARARRLRAQPRLRQEGLRQPDRADAPRRARGEGARRPRRPPRRAREVGAHLRARVGRDGRSRRARSAAR